jgi:sulfite exporter TauE/SafE
MDAADLTFVGGLLLGLASSLHCAGMCGGIASSLMFAFDRGQGGTSRVRILMTMQVARIMAYVAAGMFLGTLGSEFYGAFDHVDTYGSLRWAAAVALGWIGLSMTGLAPSLAFVDRLASPVGRLLARPASLPPEAGILAQLGSGLAWGFLPCGMVYGALFYAILTGSGAGGGLVMAGFGLGTVPSVVVTALGISSLKSLSRRPQIRVAAGVAIMLVAVLSALIPAESWEALCA